MAKRFIDSEIFSDSWFMDISTNAKVLWLYFITNCDHAGILKLNKRLCEFQTGIKNMNTTMKEISNKLMELGEECYFIPKYIEFQYPNFPQSNVRQQQGAIKILTQFGLFDGEKITLTKQSETLNKELERVNNSYDSDTVTESKEDNIITKAAMSKFDFFRKKYPGTKRGNETEFNNFKKKHKDIETVIEMLLPALEKQIAIREEKGRQGKFVPEWKNLQTWINNRCWEDETEKVSHGKSLHPKDTKVLTHEEFYGT